MKSLLLVLLLLAVPVGVYGQGVEASRIRKTSFANLQAPADSNVRDCIDCAITAGTGVCASGGTGATATRRNGAWYCSTGGTAGTAGDVVGPASSVDSEIALFSGTGGKTLKRASTTGLLKGAAGVIGAAGASDLPSGIDAAKIGGGGVSSTEYDFIGTLTSNAQTQIDGKQASLGFTAENSANKDATGGYAGLTLFKINFKNEANTFTSFFTNANSAARTYTFQNRDGTIADDTDLATKQATITFGTGVQTALGVNVGSAGAPVLFNGALGTPSSGTGTNITGIPAASILAGSFGAGAFVISTSLQAATIELGAATDTTLARVSAGVASIEGVNILASGATGVQTFLATPSSANLLATLTDETGTGVAVFGAAPTITNPVIANINPGANFTLTNNSVAAFTSLNAGALVNTLYLTAGNVGVNTTTPIFDDNSATSRYLSVDGGGTAGNVGTLGVGGNITSTTGAIGTLGFYNSALGGAEKRNVLLLAANDGATNSGKFQIYTANAGTLAAQFTVDKAGAITLSSGITDATGTPGSLCYNTSTFVVLKNNALTCTVSHPDNKISFGQFSGGLDVLLRMKPSQFAYKDDPSRERWGFFSTQLQSVDRKLGDGYDAKGEAQSIDLPAITAINTKSIQELYAIVSAQQKEIDELKARQPYD